MSEIDELASKEPHWNYLINNGEKIREISENEDYEKLKEIKFEKEPFFSFSYFNYDGERTIFNRIKRIIENAKESKSFILLSSLYINSFEIYELLIEASESLRGKIYVLIGDINNSQNSFDRNGMKQKLNINDLEAAGALIRLHPGAHLKFIVGGKQSMVFSTNLSSDGLFYNPEFGLVFEEDPWINTSLKQIFANLWHSNSEEMLINGKWQPSIKWEKAHMVFSEESQHVPASFKPLLLNSNNLIKELHKKNKAIHSTRIFDYILEILKKAKTSIDLSIFSFYPLDEFKELKSILITKQQSGIRIRILVPEIQVKKSNSMQKLLEELSNTGIEVRYYREIHGKVIIVDSKRFLMFTGNFNPYLFNDKSHDLGIYTKNLPLVRNMCKFWNLLWEEGSESPHKHPIINLDIDLAIKSQNFIDGKKRVDISLLEKQINECKEVQLIIKGENYALSIYGENIYFLNIYFDVLQTIEFENKIFLSAIIKQKPGFTLKLGDIWKINKLNLNLYWPKR